VCLHIGVSKRLIEREHLANVVAFHRAHLPHSYGPSDAKASLGP
jgi:hypothetical protein